MARITYSLKSVVAFVIGLGLMFAVLGALALPTSSHAATYAFVNQSGEVSMVIANDPMTAIATAINRALRSGVILLNGINDAGLVGDHVSGS